MNIVLVVPDSLRDKANALGEAMGWGPNNYSIPLSADGSEPITHWSLNLAQAGPDFLEMLEMAGQGQMPEDLDFPPADFVAVMQGLTAEMGRSHTEVIDGLGLRMVEFEA